MKAPIFDYVSVDKLSDVLDLLKDEVETRILAGGQSLVPMLNMRFTFPERVIDINNVKELSYISHQENIIRI